MRQINGSHLNRLRSHSIVLVSETLAGTSNHTARIRIASRIRYTTTELALVRPHTPG